MVHKPPAPPGEWCRQGVVPTRCVGLVNHAPILPLSPMRSCRRGDRASPRPGAPSARGPSTPRCPSGSGSCRHRGDPGKGLWSPRRPEARGVDAPREPPERVRHVVRAVDLHDARVLHAAVTAAGHLRRKDGLIGHVPEVHAVVALQQADRGRRGDRAERPGRPLVHGEPALVVDHRRVVDAAHPVAAATPAGRSGSPDSA